MSESTSIHTDTTVIGGFYRLESILGQGGMGSVYCASHLRLGGKTWLYLVLGLSLVCAGFLASCRRSSTTRQQSLSAKRKKVLLIGVDGCRPDALLAAPTPHLDKLRSKGWFNARAQTGAITYSGPGWSSMLTGVWAHKHGVIDNSFRGARFHEYPHFFHRLREQRPDLWTASLVHWKPIRTHIVTHANLSMSYPSDLKIALEAQDLLLRKDPDVIFLHFDNVDLAGHKYGFSPQVREYTQAITEVDGYIGQVLKAITQRKTYTQEDWLIAVSTDHGGIGRKHGDNLPEMRTIFVLLSGPGIARKAGTQHTVHIVDILPTITKHLGLTINPKWQWDGRVLP